MTMTDKAKLKHTLKLLDLSHTLILFSEISPKTLPNSLAYALDSSSKRRSSRLSETRSHLLLWILQGKLHSKLAGGSQIPLKSENTWLNVSLVFSSWLTCLIPALAIENSSWPACSMHHWSTVCLRPYQLNLLLLLTSWSSTTHTSLMILKYSTRKVFWVVFVVMSEDGSQRLKLLMREQCVIWFAKLSKSLSQISGQWSDWTVRSCNCLCPEIWLHECLNRCSANSLPNVKGSWLVHTWRIMSSERLKRCRLKRSSHLLDSLHWLRMSFISRTLRVLLSRVKMTDGLYTIRLMHSANAGENSSRKSLMKLSDNLFLLPLRKSLWMGYLQWPYLLRSSILGKMISITLLCQKQPQKLIRVGS